MSSHGSSQHVSRLTGTASRDEEESDLWSFLNRKSEGRTHIAKSNPQTDLWKELQAEDDVSRTHFYSLAKKYLRIENSVSALYRRDCGASGSALGWEERVRVDRRWAPDDQRKGKKSRYKPKKSYTLVSRRDCDRNQYTPLNAFVSAVLDKLEVASLLGEPEPMKNPPSARNSKKYCRYHRDNRHHTDKCRALKQAIEDLIKQGHFKEYIDDFAPSQEKNQGEPSKKHCDCKRVCTLNLIFRGPHFTRNSRGDQERYARAAHHDTIRMMSTMQQPQKVRKEEEITFPEKDAA
ncbi:uncharacterized protein LOC116140999 [Pistacia vera]|uniref:uncharacterized protein LOC116140999 n=1 Tax=Pistacia vera TaxID=55513 RepID=UPI0012637DBF|nr:uncharacterized protein LOC116140999 [Pistacia vera]